MKAQKAKMKQMKAEKAKMKGNEGPNAESKWRPKRPKWKEKSELVPEFVVLLLFPNNLNWIRIISK